MSTFDKTLIRFLIVSICYLELPIAPAHAAMISTYATRIYQGL
jgi:hypothetical protein